MIKFSPDIDDKFFNELTSDHYARKIKSNFLAYGNKFDFCRFFSVENEKPQAVICLFNSTMIVATVSDFVIDEDFISDIETFIEMNCPETVELNVDIVKLLKNQLADNYNAELRTDFKFCKHNYDDKLIVNCQPKLDTVYDILKVCFPQLKGNYEMWITDTSHRIRHCFSKVFLAQGCTTATLQYVIDGKALVGQVGTIPEKRGKNYARELLYYIGNELLKENIEAHIYARNHRTSFYKEIGFIPVLTDIVFERKKVNE